MLKLQVDTWCANQVKGQVMSGVVLRKSVGSGQAALKLAGIEPISMELIEAHKAAEQRKYPASLGYRIIRLLGGGKMVECIIANVTVSCFGSGVMALVASMAAGSLALLAIAVVAFALTTVLVATQLRLMHRLIRFAGPAEWCEEAPTWNELPSFATETIRKIWSVAPGTTFTVEKLVRDEEVLDPILYAHVRVPGGKWERYALVVWDEHGQRVPMDRY